MQFIDDLINFAVFRHALLTGLMVGVVCSVLSVIVVLKRMAFIGQGISHAGFGGVGTAVLIGPAVGSLFALPMLDRLPWWLRDAVPAFDDFVVLAFCIATAVLIGVMTRRRQLEADSAIGILLAGTMAWGVLMTNIATTLHDTDWWVTRFGVRGAVPSFEQLLFGSLMSVSFEDMWTALVLGLLVLTLLAVLAKEMLFFAFDETAARVFGVRTTVMYYLLLVLLSLTIVMSMRLVGFVLVSALLVIPGATAVLVSQRLGRVLVLAVAVGVLGVAGGLVLSLELNLSSGATIVGVLCAIFGVTYVGRAGLNRRVVRA
ncbi:metal ABC transporter permease [Phycisphaerales bacterium AB-hyl4]|uniref:Metal ABC transporter permease n=1 Tax=Natronomicrosphaera hydrolytica TaxID=3242702 RepID=A0ABV4U0H1_9BACT